MEPNNDQLLVDGFTVVPLKYSSTSTSRHYIFLKEHTSTEKSTAKPVGRTIIIYNVPPFCNQKCLRALFSKCGKIHQIFIHKRPTSAATENQSRFFPSEPPVKGYKVAYIVFNDVTGVRAAKMLSYDTPLDLQAPPTGLNKWMSDYKKDISVDAMNTEIEDYMKEYDAKVAERREQEKNPVVDEEGWVTVTRRTKKAMSRSEAALKNVRNKKKRKDQELVKFYTFQIKESKLEQIARLQKKFEEDKDRIAKMKAARKFKPY